MPIYDYRCQDCGKHSSIFFRSISHVLDPDCPRCGSKRMSRLISRFAVLRSEESRLEDMADPASFGDGDEDDPRSVARWARKMGSTLGEDLGPEFDEMVDRMEQGEMPDELLGGETGIGGFGGDDNADFE